MKIGAKYIVFLGMLFIWAFQVRAQFVHPGILSTKAELDYVKKNQNLEPWKSALTALKQSSSGSLNYSMQGPFTAIYRESGNTTGWTQHGKDATACYVQALLGYLTGNKIYTQNAMKLINAWSGTLQTIGGGDAALLAGIQGPLWAMAGDILAHTDTGWPEKDLAKAKDMLKNLFIPVIDDFAYESGANWGTTCMFGMMAIAVFTEDTALFEKAWNAYISTEGCPNDYSLFKNIAANGQNVESGRDQVHSWSSYEMLAGVAAIAHNQGRDPYTLGNHRLKTGVEYWCKYNLGESVPYDRSVYRCRKGWGPWNVISETGRGIPTNQGSVCRMVYRAYQRLGVDAPYTKKMADAIGNTITGATAPNGWGAPFIADALLYNTGKIVLGGKAGDHTVSLVWLRSGVVPVTQDIYRGTTPEFKNSTLIASDIGTGTAYTDATAENGMDYWYWIKSVDALGDVLYSNAVGAKPVDTTGLTDVAQEESVTVSPNPFTHFVTIDRLQDAESVQVSVLDMIGKNLVYDRTYSDSTDTRRIELDLTHVGKGMYLLLVFDGTQVTTKKIIKE